MNADTVRRAQALIDLGRHDDARTLLRQHLSTSPDDPEALCLFAQACLALADTAALHAAHEAIRLEPDNPTPLCLAAFAAAAQGRVRRAREFADAAVALDPTAYLTRYTRAQVEVFGIVVQRAGVTSARQAVRIAPDEPGGHRVLGELLRRQGKLADAKPHLEEALRLDPQDVSAHTAAAGRYLDGQRLDRAAEHYAASAGLDPQDGRVQHNIGVLIGRYVRVVHLLLIVGCIWLVDPDHGAGSVRVVAALEVVAAVGALSYLVPRARHAMRGRAGRFLRTALRRDRLLAAWVFFLVVGLGCAAAVAVLPAHRTVPWRVGYVVAVAVFASVIRLVRFLAGRSVQRPVF